MKKSYRLEIYINHVYDEHKKAHLRSKIKLLDTLFKFRKAVAEFRDKTKFILKNSQEAFKRVLVKLAETLQDKNDLHEKMGNMIYAGQIENSMHVVKIIALNNRKKRFLGSTEFSCAKRISIPPISVSTISCVPRKKKTLDSYIFETAEFVAKVHIFSIILFLEAFTMI